MKTTKAHWTFGLIIFLLAFIQYSNTLGHDFAWDDKIVIQENDRVQQGLSGIPKLFLKYNSDLRKDQYGYRPITLTSFAIDYALAAGEPGLFHFMNILYFGILCLVLFVLLNRMFKEHSPLLPFLITILFAVHPIHVEVVANIKSRDEILALLFCLLSLLQFLNYLERKQWKSIGLTILFFGLAFLSKENAITFIPIYIISALIVTRITWKQVLQITGFLIVPLTLIVVCVSYYALNSNLGQQETSGLGLVHENPILGNAFFHVDNFGDKVANASYLVLLYLKDFFAPFNLAYYHGLGDIKASGVNWLSLVAFLLCVSAFVFALIRLKKQPLISFGVLFFFITLSVYLHVGRALADTRADRFLFFASIGLCIVLIGILSKLLRIDFRAPEVVDKISVFKSLKALNFGHKMILAAIILFFSIITFSRNAVWKNDMTLVQNDMERLESSARPHYYIASNLLIDIEENGWTEDKEECMIHHYKRSMQLSDSIYYSRIELGGYYGDQGQLEKAKEVFQEMVRIYPTKSDPRFYYGKVLVQLEKYQESIEQLEKSIEYAPKNSDAYYLLAISYGKTKQYDKGITLAKDGLRNFPNEKLSMYEALGHIYYDMGDMELSTANTLKMVEFGGNPYTIYATIIGRYQEKGDKENAAKYYNEAIQHGIMTAQ